MHYQHRSTLQYPKNHNARRTVELARQEGDSCLLSPRVVCRVCKPNDLSIDAGRRQPVSSTSQRLSKLQTKEGPLCQGRAFELNIAEQINEFPSKLGVSQNKGTGYPQNITIFIGFSLINNINNINHPFWGTPFMDPPA